jgi:hypothetical protein
LDTLKIKPGDTVYTKVNHVSRSGMSRNIEAYVMRENSPVNISTSAATITESPIAKDGGVKMGGCGMDMGFALVYDLAYRLFPDGFGEPCQEPGCTFKAKTKEEAAEANALAGHGVTPHSFRGRNGETSGWDNDGGYALKQRWM